MLAREVLQGQEDRRASVAGSDDEEGEKEKYDMMFNGDVGMGGQKWKKRKKGQSCGRERSDPRDARRKEGSR